MGLQPLQDRYHDWCSAVVVERLSALSPDEVYRRSRPAEPGGLPRRDPAQSVNDAAMQLLAAAPGHGSSEADEQFRRLVVSLVHEEPLPSFETWAESYARDPRPYDALIMGFRSHCGSARGAFEV